MKKLGIFVLLLSFGFVLSACDENASTTAPAPLAGSASSLADPKGSIGHQFNLLKAGDVENLRLCFTERQRDRITQESVTKGKEQAANYTLEDLVASVEMGQDSGNNTAKIKMKNGRTLTTLIQTDGKWLADTVWFK